MLSSIKAYQSETASQRSFSQKNHFWFWLVAAMFAYIHTKWSACTDWMVFLNLKNFEFLKSCILKWENGQRTNWSPTKKCTLPLIGKPPWNQKSKIQTPPNLNGRCTLWYYFGFFSWGTHLHMSLFLSVRLSTCPSHAIP